MIVLTERTPNPRTLKFLPGVEVASRSVEFDAAASARHPFLSKVFALAGIESVFLGPDFVSVTASDAELWGAPELRARLAEMIGEHVGTLSALAQEEAGHEAASASATVMRIRDILASHVRPAVAADGGDIVFKSFEDGVLVLSMKGACSGCPSSTATLKQGIQSLMRYMVPEVKEVRAAEAG